MIGFRFRKQRPENQRAYYRGLLRTLDLGTASSGGPAIGWINPYDGKIRRWQYAPILDAVEDSSPGFETLLRLAIERRLRKRI